MTREAASEPMFNHSCLGPGLEKVKFSSPSKNYLNHPDFDTCDDCACTVLAKKAHSRSRCGLRLYNLVASQTANTGKKICHLLIAPMAPFK